MKTESGVDPDTLKMRDVSRDTSEGCLEIIYHRGSRMRFFFRKCNIYLHVYITSAREINILSENLSVYNNGNNG